MGRRLPIWLTGIATLAVSVSMPRDTASGADQQAATCQSGLTDDTLRPLTPALVSHARQLFRLTMTDDQIQRSTVYRCLNGRTLLCTAGANLVCGKANVRRDLPGVAAWCRDHDNTDSVPMSVTGHDTIYSWRCSGGAPEIAATIDHVDARGFLSRNWKALEE